MIPTTFEEASLTEQAAAGAVLYIAATIRALHAIGDTSHPHEWAFVAAMAAEAECCWAEALQRMARAERPRRY